MGIRLGIEYLKILLALLWLYIKECRISYTRMLEDMKDKKPRVMREYTMLYKHLLNSILTHTNLIHLLASRVM